MHKTRHIQTRMKERGITDMAVEIALNCGVRDKRYDDRVVLSKKGCKKARDILQKCIKQLERLERQGGLSVVACEEDLITAFFVDSYKQVRS